MKVVISSSENREVFEKIKAISYFGERRPPITQLEIEDHPVFVIVVKIDAWVSFRYSKWDHFLLNWPELGEVIQEILETHFPELFL